MRLGKTLSTAAELSKFMWKDLGLGKFLRKNAGKLIESAVKRLPDGWKNKVIAAAELVKNMLGNDNEIAENLTAGVNEAKGIGNKFKMPLDSQNEVRYNLG